jgi:DNA primase catalytic subunit
MIARREFGFMFSEGLMLRHKSLKSDYELREFLQNSAPSNAYCPCAYYEDPEAEMERKGWLARALQKRNAFYNSAKSMLD